MSIAYTYRLPSESRVSHSRRAVALYDGLRSEIWRENERVSLYSSLSGRNVGLLFLTFKLLHATVGGIELTFLGENTFDALTCELLSRELEFITIRGVSSTLEAVTDKKVTWLILPVVICLSQRLSHACLSINNFILWNCERLIISAIIYLMVPYYMDNCSNSRANTCVKSQLLRGGMYLLDKKPMRALSGFVVNHSNFSNRMASRRR
jgi:hypothetical protein